MAARKSFSKFQVTLNGGTFEIPVSFEGDSDSEASAIVIDTIPGFAPVSVLRTLEGKRRVRYIRIPVKGGYIVVKIETTKRRKTFDAEIRKIYARADITDGHLMYFSSYHLHDPSKETIWRR